MHRCLRDVALGPDAVGLLLGRSGRTITRWAAAKQMPAPITDPGGNVRWRRADIEAFVQCGCNMPRYRAMRRK